VDNLAFIQFHPTALWSSRERPFLISEAVRGEGGVLMDNAGLAAWKEASKAAEIKGETTPSPEPYSFTLKHSPEGSMATRDIVARAIDQQMKTTGTGHVYLVTSHLDKEGLARKFPTIAGRLAKERLELGVDPIPVVPAAHYMVGGIRVDAIGRAHVRQPARIEQFA
jgi:L-aspartate oxidase